VTESSAKRDAAKVAPFEFVLSRTFDAPRELVWPGQP
jgi:hypothetical protein